MLAILTTHPIQYQVPLWQALAKDGRVPFEVWYLTSHATTPARDREFGKEFAWDLDMLAGYPHKFLNVAAGASPGSFWKCRLREKLRGRLRVSGARALWINGWQVAAYWQAVREAKAAGVEVWLRGESNNLREERRSKIGDSASVRRRTLKQRAKTIVLSQLFTRVDRFLYIGSANKRLYQKFGVPDEKLFPAPYAVDNERFAAQALELGARRMELREEWRIPQNAFCVLFCGKFIPKKRPMDLIAAAVRLLSKEQGAGSRESAGNTPSSDLQSPRSVHLLFAGSGELGAELRAACNVVFDQEHGAGSEGHGVKTPSSQLPAPSSKSPRASFTGFLNQTQVSSAYVAADVLVLPSDYEETWGLVVNEAMASGLPCIVSDRCGCAEDLVASTLIYKAGDVDALADTIQRFAESSGTTQSKFPPPSFATTIDSVVSAYNSRSLQ